MVEVVYLCPRCKGNDGRFCLVCSGTGVYAPSSDPEEVRRREEVLQLHVQLDVALADVDLVKWMYKEAIYELPEDLQAMPGSLADAVRTLAERAAGRVAVDLYDPINTVDK